jgi:hypothetical protein
MEMGYSGSCCATVERDTLLDRLIYWRVGTNRVVVYARNTMREVSEKVWRAQIFMCGILARMSQREKLPVGELAKGHV